jgi:biopolymer transport protein ExbD
MRLATCLVLAACSSHTPAPTAPTTTDGQSFHDGVQALCDVPDHVPDGASYETRLAGTSEWAQQHVTNLDAKQVGRLSDLAKNRDDLAAAVAKAHVEHCKLLDNGMELQSFADAMRIVCDPRATEPGYFKAHLLNTEVVRLFTALGDANPADRQILMHDAIVRAGLTSCAMQNTVAAAAAKRAPAVPDVGLDAIADAAVVELTPTGIVIDGKMIVQVVGGDVDVAEKEGGVQGIAIPRIREYAKALRAAVHDSNRPFIIAADPTTSYRLLIETMFSIKAAGVSDFQLAVDAGGTLKAIPIVLPDAKPAAKGLRMVVAITTGELMVWSLSGSEGTLKKPKLKVAIDRVADVQTALAEIADRRWHGGKRPDDDRAVLVVADGDVPMKLVAPVLAAVRTTAAGTSLFPDIRLATGFETRRNMP